MSIPNEVTEQFLAGTRSDRVQFVVNDPVRVTAGPHKDRKGAVISVFSVEPVTTYLVEPDASPWGDFQVAQSALEAAD